MNRSYPNRGGLRSHYDDLRGVCGRRGRGDDRDGDAWWDDGRVGAVGHTFPAWMNSFGSGMTFSSLTFLTNER